MVNSFDIIQRLLQEKADYQARLKLIPYDGSPEIKENNSGRYLYMRKRVNGKLTSTYIDVYSDELENKVSIFSGSFRYLVPRLIKSIQNNNLDEVNIAATPKDSIYCLKILDAIKESSNKGISINFNDETNNYF